MKIIKLYLIIKLCLIRNNNEIIKLRKIFTKTLLAKFDVYFFKHFTGTIPGEVQETINLIHTNIRIKILVFLYVFM